MKKAKIKRKVARQFDDIWRKATDPEEIAKQRIIKNRQERVKAKKDDLSL